MGNAQRKVAHHPSKGPYIPTPLKKVHWDGPGLPAPPGKPILIPGDDESQPDVVGIRWERSPHNGGSAIIGYHVEHRKMGSPHWVRSAPVLCTFPELTLSGLEPGWRYQFRIRAQNALGLSEPSELSDPLSVTLQRTASIAPRFDQELRDCVTVEGEQAEFTVLYSGTPLPKISWFKDGFEIFSSRRTIITTDSGRSILVIYRTSIDDEGEIKCSATNRAGHVSTRARLMIEAPPHVRLPRQYEEGLLFEQGETIRLKATNGGRPPPSITWYHNGEIIIVDQRHNFETITDNETILKIQDAKRQDRGEYAIRAINKLGEDVASFLVTVTDRPAAPGKTIITEILGKSVALAWLDPDDDGGCKIGTYIVEYYRLGWDVWLKAATCRQTTATLNDLIEGSEYRFRVKAENPYGLSDPSEESDVVFIPDPKRGITEPNMRAKSASHRDIPRGRSERREVSFREPTQRTRSLTREEASNREAMAAYERTTSTQRLLSGQQAGQRPSRADSRVTFALDTAARERGEVGTRRQWSKEMLPQPGEIEIMGRATSPQTAVVITPSFNDSGGQHQRSYLDSRMRSQSPYARSHSPSPLVLEETTELAIQESLRSHLSPPRTPRRRRSSAAEITETSAMSLSQLRRDEEEINMLHGSSEFMLVLYPGEEDGRQHQAERMEKESEVVRRDSRESKIVSTVRSVERQSAIEAAEESEDEDLVPPPMSLSLPELFSIEHQVVEVYREAVSSTELLHERAMERFYKAVEAEKSRSQIDTSKTSTKKSASPDHESYPLFNARTRPVRRRLSNSGSHATTWQLKRERRRSSEGQPKVTITPAMANSLKLTGLEGVSSDPNLPTSDEMLAQKKAEPWAAVVGGSGSAERLRRWHEPGIDLSNDESIADMINKENTQNKAKEELLKLTELSIKETMVEEEYDEVAPDTSEILAEDSIETSYASEAESTDSEDLKQLKARIMAIPVVQEEDTYNPRGRTIMHMEQSETPPPVPPHRVPHGDFSIQQIPDRKNLSPAPMSPTSSNSNIVPKSILKKRTETEPVPVNQFGRPIPPEKPLRKSLSAYDDAGLTTTISSREFANMGYGDDILPVQTNEDIPTMEFIATSTPIPPSSPPPTPIPTLKAAATTAPVIQTDSDVDKEAVISAGEAAVSKRRQMRQGSKTQSVESEEDHEEKLAVVSHYTELVRQYSNPEYRQRSLSRDREQRRYQESPSESRVASPIQNVSREPSVHRERLPPTPGKIIQPIPPTIPLGNMAKIIEPIPPVIPTTPIQKAKPIDPSEHRSRRRSITNKEPEERGKSNERRSRKSDTTPTRKKNDSRTTLRNESRPPSRNESPMPRSRNVSRDRGSSVAPESRSSSTTREPRPKGTRRSSVAKSSRPSSRSSSKDRSRATTPTEAKMERLQKALEDKKDRMRRASTKDENRAEVEAEAEGGEAKNDTLTIEAERKVRSTINYAIDVGLLLAALYVYLFKKEILAIPIIGLLLYRYVQQEITGWVPAWMRTQKR